MAAIASRNSRVARLRIGKFVEPFGRRHGTVLTMLAPYENENQLPREFWEAEMLFIGHGTISLFVRQMRIVAQIRPSPRVSLCPTRRLESKRARAIAGGASLWAAIELTPLD